MRLATCTDCGREWGHQTMKGPVPQRCAACTKTHQRRYHTEYMRLRRKAKRLRRCAECGLQFFAAPWLPGQTHCDGCRAS